MHGYAKVFQSMYTGSMYGAGIHVFAVWGWILAHKDENGLVEVNAQLVANELGGVAQQVEEAITYLCAPDPNSRTPEQEGRRLLKVSQFGYQVVNNEKYRDRGGSRAEYWRQWRAQERQGATVAQRCAQPMSTQTETKTETEIEAYKEKKEKKATIEEEFEKEFWPSVPNKIGKRAALRSYTEARERGAKDQIVGALPAYRAYEDHRKRQRDYRPLHPSTWLNQDRWLDEWEDMDDLERAGVSRRLTEEEADAMLRRIYGGS